MLSPSFGGAIAVVVIVIDAVVVVVAASVGVVVALWWASVLSLARASPSFLLPVPSVLSLSLLSTLSLWSRFSPVCICRRSSLSLSLLSSVGVGVEWLLSVSVLSLVLLTLGLLLCLLPSPLSF